MPVGALALAAGCVSISGGDSPQLVQYVLDDRGIGAAPVANLPRIDHEIETGAFFENPALDLPPASRPTGKEPDPVPSGEAEPGPGES